MTRNNNKIIKAPISFEQFSKDPVKGLLFITLIVIGYLYIDGKMNYQAQITKHEEKIIVLENKIDLLPINSSINLVFSSLASVANAV